MEGKIIVWAVSLFLLVVCIRASWASSEMAGYLCELGINYYDIGKYQDALTQFKGALLLEPKNEIANYYINKIFEKTQSQADEGTQTQLAAAFPQPSKPEEKTKRIEEEPIEELKGVLPGKFALNSQASIFTGDYGDLNGKSTTVGYLTETVKYIGEEGEVSLSLPYVIRNGGGVTAGENVATSTRTIPKRADGIGDTVLKGKYYWLEETDWRPIVDLIAKVKFPTANDDRGLGTGKYDFGLGTSFLKRFGKVIGLFDADLVLRQRPTDSSIKRARGDYSLGAGYLFTSKMSGYLFLDGSTKTSKTQKTSDSPLELILAGTYKHSKDLSFNGYALKGFTNGSPEFGGSLGVTKYF